MNCALCGVQVEKVYQHHTYCSPQCQDKDYSYRHPSKAIKKRMNHMNLTRIRVLMALEDNDGLPRLLGVADTYRTMEYDHLIQHVGNGYWMLSPVGVRVLDAYRKGL